jgi:hypothetical protein
MKRHVDTLHGARNALRISHVPDIEAKRRMTKPIAHLFLLHFVPAEYSDLGTPFGEEVFGHRLTEGASPAGDQNATLLDHALLGAQLEASGAVLMATAVTSSALPGELLIAGRGGA